VVTTGAVTLSPSDAKTFSLAQQTLKDWWMRSPDVYQQLFEGSPVLRCCLTGDLAPLHELGVIEVIDSVIMASKAVYPVNGLFIVCDFPTNRDFNRVFPVFSDESELLARWITVRPGDIVLDVGTGSGIVALMAAQKGASKVFASDINNKVNQYFELTVRLNGFVDRLEYVHSDVFQAFDKMKFDVIVSNPPFVPIPNQFNFYTHSDGGPLGTVIIEKLLNNVENHLNQSGHFYLLALSLGSEKVWRIDSLLADTLQEAGSLLTSWTAPLYKKPLLDLSAYTRRFAQADDYNNWLQELNNHGYDRLGYFALYAGGSANPMKTRLVQTYEQLFNNPPLFWRNYVGTMKRRLQRYL
jgi:release factor glutamine methyltransferase